jgi:hypothetical protein
MLFWIIQSGVFSTVLILLVHHLIKYYTTILTTPIIKDLVNDPNIKYDNMLNVISNNKSRPLKKLEPIGKTAREQEIDKMKIEIKSFLTTTPEESHSTTVNDDDMQFYNSISSGFTYTEL